MYSRFSVWLTESKQSIISFGFPEVIAKIFYGKFGNKAPLIAKWFKEANNRDNSDNWWRQRFGGFSIHNLDDYTRLYQATYSFFIW